MSHSSQDFSGLNEAYKSIYESQEPEQLNELIGAAISAGLGYLGAKAGKGFIQGLRGDNKPAAKTSPTPTKKEKQGPPVPPRLQQKPSAPSTSKPTPTAAAKPTPAAKPSTPAAPAKPAPGTKAAGPESIKPKTPNPLLKDKSIERMQQASQMRQKGANVTSDMISDKSVKAPAPKPQMSARAQALKAGGPAGGAREKMLNQGVDIFDLVKGHLLDEGYAETEENAVAMMANMSEEWRQSIINEISKELATKAFATRARDAFEMDDIKQHDKADKTKERIVKKHGKKAGDEAEKAAERAIYGHNKYSEAQEREEEKKKSTKKEGIELEDILALNRRMERVYEAQRARENPEDHDKEEKRKYEPVRGEKTPMPPRGDKRREEFEKWYAKQMGR